MVAAVVAVLLIILRLLLLLPRFLMLLLPTYLPTYYQNRTNANTRAWQWNNTPLDTTFSGDDLFKFERQQVAEVIKAAGGRRRHELE